jgi:hypothetical protein
MSTDLAERLLSWAQNEEMIDVHYTGHGLDCISAHDELKRLHMRRDNMADNLTAALAIVKEHAAEIERLRKLADERYDAGFRVGIEKAPSYKENQELRDEIEVLHQQAIEDDAALARAGYLHDKLSSLVRRFYRQCEDANVWFPMDTTLMRDAKRALGDG